MNTETLWSISCTAAASESAGC